MFAEAMLDLLKKNTATALRPSGVALLQDLPLPSDNTTDSIFAGNAAPNTNKRRHTTAVVDLDDMVDASLTCCKRLQCVEAFVTGKADVKVLRA